MANNQGSGRGRGEGGGRGRNGGRGGARNNNGNHTSAAATATTTKPVGATVPANWPPDVVYLAIPAYAGISPAQRKMLQTQPGDGADGGQQQQQQRQRGRRRPVAAPPLLGEVPSIQRFGPSALVEIRTITDPGHPACGQRGLFAARALRPNSFVVPYLGIYHRGHVTIGSSGKNTRRESDYDLWLDRAADVAVDAAVAGNEARFVNDYRGTGRPRPNAEFREVWDPRRGERGMAVFVLPAGKRALASGGGGDAAAGIAKGDEILVSYGKGFWEKRQKEAQEVQEVPEEETQKTQKTQKSVETQEQQPDYTLTVLPDDNNKHKTDEQPLPSPSYISYARAAANAAVR